LEAEANLCHPRDKNGKKIPVCSSFTGCMGCCKEYERSDLNVIGLGMTTYLKIIKTLGFAFFIIILLNIFLFIVYTNSNKSNKIKNYKDALFRTTIGNIGSGKIFIKIIKIRNISLSKIRSKEIK
jgi:hypothetical protein